MILCKKQSFHKTSMHVIKKSQLYLTSENKIHDMAVGYVYSERSTLNET